MNIKRYERLIIENLTDFKFVSEYIGGPKGQDYKVSQLIKLRTVVENLSPIEIISEEITKLKKSTLYRTHKDEDLFSMNEYNVISNNLQRIRIGLDFLLRYDHQIETPENGLLIKLPEISSFDDLSRVSNDLKKALEIPISDQNQGGSLKIVTAESGSIWLILSVTTLAAVNLVGAICWSAAVIRKKSAEAKLFVEHARTLELKNDSLSTFVEAQKQQIKNILQAEAEAIAHNHYSANDAEAIGRLKLSINTVSDLIDRGSQILPTSDTKETLKSFPDYSNLSLIESTIKRLGSEN